MDSFELNKIAGAVLGSLLFLMGLGVISDALFAAPHMAKPGYALPAAEESHGAPAAAAAPEVVTPLPVLLAKADPKKGEGLVKACAACHSDNMKAKGGKWGYEQINAFIANPKGVVAGTKMSYAGEKDAAKRADIIAYLRSLSSSPAALPAP